MGLAVFARALARPSVRLEEQRHTEHDTLLGWINLPHVASSDMFGRGVGLHTNGQRFRHVGDLMPRPPAGRRRVVCSGDAFTLGYGVDDAHAWCSLLGPAGGPLETVNMGQAGYGIDQSYLWYVRDGLPLHPDVHLFAYITYDFSKMRDASRFGHPKPRLLRDGASVRAIGVPVPSPGIRPLVLRLMRAVQELQIFKLIQWLKPSQPDSARAYEADSVTWEVADAALRDLARRNRAAGTAFVVVTLPTRRDHEARDSERWRRWARASAERGEFRYVDLIEPFRQLPADSVERLFTPENALPYLYSGGQYSAAGNAWVARQLRRLVPELRTGASP